MSHLKLELFKEKHVRDNYRIVYAYPTVGKTFTAKSLKLVDFDFGHFAKFFNCQVDDAFRKSPELRNIYEDMARLLVVHGTTLINEIKHCENRKFINLVDLIVLPDYDVREFRNRYLNRGPVTDEVSYWAKRLSEKYDSDLCEYEQYARRHGIPVERVRYLSDVLNKDNTVSFTMER